MFFFSMATQYQAHHRLLSDRKHRHKSKEDEANSRHGSVEGGSWSQFPNGLSAQCPEHPGGLKKGVYNWGYPGPIFC